MTAPACAGRLLILGCLISACAAGPAEPEKEAGPAAPAPAPRPEHVFPIRDGVLPEDEVLLPNGPRRYRGGIHEGVDLYYKKSGSKLVCGEPVLNASGGWITRVDHDWRTMRPEEYERLTGLLKERTDPENDGARLDRLRGRQVWVRAEDGTVYRYCHLRSIEKHVVVGARMAAGVLLGRVGNSGTRGGVLGGRKNCHLHFEIRLPSGKYLGQGQSPARGRELYARLFGLD